MMSIEQFLDRLYRDGCQNDMSVSERDSKMLNITPSTGAFLELLIVDAMPTRILEIGTSNGYSTCWIARAASRVGAKVATVDCLSSKTEAAHRNLVECGLADHVGFHTWDAGGFLREAADNAFDFVFLDSDRSAYQSWMQDLFRVTEFGLMVVDNAVSHRDELAGFRDTAVEQYGLAAVTLPIGKGQLILQPHE